MDEPLPEITRSDLRDTLIAIAIFVVAAMVAVLVSIVLPRLAGRFLRSGERSGLRATIQAVRWPVFWLTLVQGVFLALRYPGYMASHENLLDRLWVATIVVAVVGGAIRLTRVWTEWYEELSARSRMPGRIQPRVLNLIRRSVNIALIVIGGLMLLDVLGLEITPLIAGLGVGGLAVGLALQGVLSSIFASSSMLSDSSLHVGDLVEVEGGPVGTVEHVGWRATRVRDFDNNIVLIPNAKLADATMTNYSSSSHQADARLVFGIAYEEDLRRVEEVVVDELTQLRDDFEGAVKSYEPLFLYRDFEESRVTALIKLRADTWLDSFTLRHLMVKRVHGRLAAEGIAIAYPARRLMPEVAFPQPSGQPR